MGRWRAAVLIGVHVLIALHIWHWKATGKTITPVEPSEAMQTLELGYVNAGFIFFALAILSTLIFGRWFCGWGCHIVALQDLCGWLLKKVGLRPKPFRSRLLVWVPVFAAFYMFVWPQVVRIWEGREAPPWVLHLETENFWATFPNLPIALLTFGVCGFLIVYVLGNKGFCTYGCPYGGIFYHADRLAPGKIRVTDACMQCGHCTATCTSNVRVSEEVREYGMVVDPGCMKCMDCVSVCPTNALYYGFGKVGVAAKKGLSPVKIASSDTGKGTARRYDFTVPEEILLGATFIAAVYAYRGLYEAIPFLLSLGLAAIASFVVVSGVRLVYKPHARMQNWLLKREGKLYPAGWVFAIAAIGTLGSIAFGSIVNYHVHEGNRLLITAQRLQKDSALESERAARGARSHYLAAIRIGRYPVAEWHYKVGSIAQFLGDFQAAKREFRKALSLDSNRPNTRLQLAELYFRDGEFESAITEYRKLANEGQLLGPAWEHLALSAIRTGEDELLEEAYKKLPPSSEALLEIGVRWAGQGRFGDAVETLEKYTSAKPRDSRGWLNLAVVYATQRELASAWKAVSRALELERTGPALAVAAKIAFDRKEVPLAVNLILEAIEAAPSNKSIAEDLAEIARRSKLGKQMAQRLRPKVAQKPELAFAIELCERANEQP